MPFEQFAAPFLSSLGSGIGKSVLGADPAGPSNAVSGNYGGGLDGAGFVVNFGTQVGSGNPSKLGADAAGMPGVATAGFGSNALLALLAIGAVVYFIRKRKGGR